MVAQPRLLDYDTPATGYGLRLVPLPQVNEELDCFDDEDIPADGPGDVPRLRTADDIFESTIALYPFQRDAIAEIENGFEIDGLRTQRLILPTGTGKTRCFATFTKRRIREKKKVLIAVHRNDLLRQAMEKLSEIGVVPLKEQGDSHARAMFGDRHPCVIGSVQSLHRDRVRLWPRDSFDYLISDECHHVTEKSHWRKIAKWFYTAQHLGVTATPGRMKGKRYINIGGWQRDIEPIQILDAIQQGYLSPLVFKIIKTDIDLRSVGRVFGNADADFNQNELDAVIYENTNKLATAIKENIGARPSIAFTPLVASAEALSAALNDIGVRAGVVSYKTDDPLAIYQAHKNGEFQVLCNAMKCTEGFDAPYIEAVILARPTQSVNVYRQCVGRGTRLSKETGKENCLILDFAFVTGSLPLVGAPEYIRQDDDMDEEDADLFAQFLAEIMASGEEVELTDAIAQAKVSLAELKEKERIAREIEARKAAALEARRLKNHEEKFRYEVTTLDPFATNLLGIPERANLNRSMTIEPATDRQKQAITNMTKGKINVEHLTKYDAGEIIGQLKADSEKGLCSYPQREVLTRRLGRMNLTPEVARTMTREAASAYISEHKTW